MGLVHREDTAVFDAVVTLLDQFKREEAIITRETDISEDLRLDSLAVMDLMMELEDKFDVSIPLNLVAEIRTVGDLAEAVRRH
ncbi:MAG: acyl carrier protein [Dongiaceae bacterium]|jgi:acyl carrier protein